MKQILLVVFTMFTFLMTQPINAGGNDEQVTPTNGKASFYGKSHHGKKMANGKIFDMNKMTCAHKTLPFGTKLKVTNIDNGKSVIVEVTDRGPYIKGRIIDLSEEAFKQIAPKKQGIAKVEVVELTTERNLL